MRILLTVAAILLSGAIGAATELRWPERTGRIARQAMKVALYGLLPPVVFFNIARLQIDHDIAVGLLLGLLANATAGTIAYLAATRIFQLTRPQTGAMICLAMVANTGYLGYPLVAALLGFDSLSQAVAYDVVVSGTTLLLGAFAVGAAFGDTAGETVKERIKAYFTRNPPLVAAILALIAPDSFSPDVIVDITRVVVIALLPLGFFVVGATLAEEAEEGIFKLKFPEGPVLTSMALKMIFVPAVLFGLGSAFIDLPGPYLLQAAMPCGINSVVVGHIYGLDLRMISQGIAWSTALAIVASLASLAFT